jgi:hypothetical protein
MQQETPFTASGLPRRRRASPVLTQLERVTDELSWLLWDEQVWRDFERIAQGSAVARDSFFAGWVGELYYRRASLAVRAMHDGRDDSYSLRNLLEDVRESAVAGSVAVTPEAVNADLMALGCAVARVKRYASKVLAHHDKAAADAEEPPGIPVPGPEVVDAAIEVLRDLVIKYTLILRGVDADLRPVPQFGWTEVFREPWLPCGVPELGHWP